MLDSGPLNQLHFVQIYCGNLRKLVSHQLICIENQLTSFHMIRVFTETCFWTDYNFNLGILDIWLEIKFILHYVFVRLINNVIGMLQLLHMTDYQTLKYGMSMYQSVMMYFRSSRQNAFCKKVFLEISQNKQENTCARVSFLIKFQALGLHRYQKRDSGTGVFPWILWNC